MLVGYDLLTDCILYRDPGSRDSIIQVLITTAIKIYCILFSALCSTSLRFFECARKCLGTDEDVLFLHSDFVRF